MAHVDGEDVRVRIVGAETLDGAAARHHKGLRIFLRDEAPLSSIQQRLAGRGEGEVSLVLMVDQMLGEVEVRLPGRYPVSAAVAGALKAISGVVAVEHV